MLSIDFTMKDGRAVNVRSYKVEDFEPLLFLFQQLSKEALRYGLPPYDRPRIERWLSRLNGGVILLAFHEERVVGVAVVFGRGNPRLRGIGEFFTYIHQDYHGKGLGTFLTRTILGEVKSKGFHRVGLQVVADNAAAIKAYENAGFVREGRLKDAFLDDEGKYHDELVMGIIL